MAESPLSHRELAEMASAFEKWRAQMTAHNSETLIQDRLSFFAGHIAGREAAASETKRGTT